MVCLHPNTQVYWGLFEDCYFVAQCKIAWESCCWLCTANYGSGNAYKPGFRKTLLLQEFGCISSYTFPKQNTKSLRISKGAMYASDGWNIFLLPLLGIWGLFTEQNYGDELKIIIWELKSQPNIYLCVQSYEHICSDMLVNASVEVFSSLRVSGCKQSEAQAKSWVSVQSFCVVSPHTVRTASSLPASCCFCRVKVS